MQSKKYSIGLGAALALFAVVLIANSWAAAQQDMVLYPFESMFSTPADGNYPYASLIFDKAGNLYGTTEQGGDDAYCSPGCGIVFELSPPAISGDFWVETILYEFGATGTDGTDGEFPYGGVIFDTEGNLYGTTVQGGKYGFGTVFELKKPANPGETWKEKILHSFNDKGGDGYGPFSSLVFDFTGVDLYGTTYQGGKYGFGTAFELTPLSPPSTGWHETKLHDFGAGPTDGRSPYDNLIFDTAGNLYGTTYGGGSTSCTLGCGTVFELTPPSSPGAPWMETPLHQFNGTDGAYPVAGLLFDLAGNLYGTTFSGGKDGVGTVFELTYSSSTSPPWHEKPLHQFDNNGTDGEYPEAGLIFDSNGNLYGTTFSGGDATSCSGGCGTVFEYNFSGVPHYEIRTAFSVPTLEGNYPHASLIPDADGNLYGTTTAGGVLLCDDCGYGTVFEIAP